MVSSGMPNRLPSVSTKHSERSLETRVLSLFNGFEKFPRARLNDIATSHGIQIGVKLKNDEIRTMIISHLIAGTCVSNSPLGGCAHLCSMLSNTMPQFRNILLRCFTSAVSASLLRRVLYVCGLVVSDSYDLADMQSHIDELAGPVSSSSEPAPVECSHPVGLIDRCGYAHQWPVDVDFETNMERTLDFVSDTSSAKISKKVCASCSELTSVSSLTSVDTSALNMDVFLRPDMLHDESDLHPLDRWLDLDTESPPMPCSDIPGMENLLLDRTGITDDGRSMSSPYKNKRKIDRVE